MKLYHIGYKNVLWNSNYIRTDVILIVKQRFHYHKCSTYDGFLLS